MIGLRRAALGGAFLAAVSAPPAGAFNPDPRPAPGTANLVCADDATVACDASDPSPCASGTCVVDPADVVPSVVVRGTLTLITDEDVTGWEAGADASGSRSTNARFTMLLQYERDGVLRTFAETYVLSADDCGISADLALCVPSGVGWNQPASEAVITDPQLNVAYSVPGAQLAKAVAVDLTGDAATTKKPFLDIVDRLPATTSDRSGDSLASVQQLKVTIRLLP
jgi:hypothetical protein